MFFCLTQSRRGAEELLDKAIAKVKTLSTEAQDAIATIILEELEYETKWDTSFANSQDTLANLAN